MPNRIAIYEGYSMPAFGAKGKRHKHRKGGKRKIGPYCKTRTDSLKHTPQAKKLGTCARALNRLHLTGDVRKKRKEFLRACLRKGGSVQKARAAIGSD